MRVPERHASIWRSLFSLVFLLAPISCDSAAEQNDRVARHHCRQNLSAIYDAVKSYASKNDGMLPSTFQDLIKSQSLALPIGEVAVNVLICPGAADDSNWRPVSLADWADNVRVGKHVSYIMLRRSQKLEATSRIAIISEHAGHHLNGCHVLYSDGSIEFVAKGR